MIAGTLEIQLLANMARLQADMEAAKNSVGNAMKSIETAVGYAKAALVSFIGVASINAFKGMVQGSIEATAGLHDMAIQTGASVAALAAFRSVASTSETSIEGIAAAMNKMAKSMAGADEDSKGVGQAVKAIGLNFNDLRAMKPDEQMLAVAKALDGFQDGAGKSAVAMTLFGKEGAKMLPFLKDLADESDAVAAKMTEQQVAAKAAQAAMADDYADNLTKIKKASDGWKKDVSMALLPALFEASQAFRDVTTGAGGVKDGISKLSADGSITNWARMAITGVTYVMDVFEGLKAVVTSVGHVIGGYAALIGEQWGATGTVIAKIIKGDFAGATSEVAASFERQKSIVKDLGTTLDATWGAQTFGSKLRDRMEQLQGVAAVAKVVKENLKFEAKGDAPKKDVAEKVSDYQKLTRVIAEKQSADDLQLITGNLLTESDKIRAKMQADLSTGAIKLTASEIASTEAGLKKLAATELQIAAEKFYAEQGKKRFEASSALIKTAVAEAEKNEILARTFGMTREAIEQAEIAALEAQLTQKTTIGLCAAETAELEALIDAKKRNATAVASVDSQKAMADANKKLLEEQQKTVEKYDDIFRGGFADMLNNGKGAWESFSKSLVTTFKTSVADQIYKMFAQPFIMKIIASLIGVTGSAAATAANAAGAAGSGSGALGTASNAYSAYGSLAGGAAAFSGAFSAGAAVGMEAFSAGATMMAEATGISSFMAGAGQMLGAIGPAGWVALAAIAVLSLSGGYTSAESTGYANKSYSDKGIGTGINVTSSGAEKMVDSLYSGYAAQADALGIKQANTRFSYSSNTGREGQNPNFTMSAESGGKNYITATDNPGLFGSTEVALTPEHLQLEASRAIFTALQGSELPKYLKGAFDGLTASEMTQDQINKTMAAAQSVKSFHDQLQLLPFEALKDLSFKASAGLAAAAGGLSNLGSMLGTYYDKFYSADEKTALMTKNTSKAFADLGLVMPAIGSSTRAAYRAMIEELEAKDMSVEANAKAYAGALALAGAIDQLAPALEDAAKATAKAAIDTAKNGTSTAYAALERAVSAQRASYELTASIASEQVSAIGSVFGVLKSNVQSLYSQVASSAAMQADQGNAFIDRALSAAQSTGYLPDSAALGEAISAARAGAEGAVYASQQDADFARLVLAGKLSQMEAISGTQLTEAQKALKLAQDQISGLDEILKVSKSQLDAANGIDTSILSVADAVKLVNDSIKTLISAQAITGDATRMESISSYIKSIYDNSSATAEAGSLGKISDEALKYNVSMSDVARSMKLSLESVQALYQKFGVQWKSTIGSEWMPSAAATSKPLASASSSGVVSVGGGGGAKAPSFYDSPKYYNEYALGSGSSFVEITDAAAIARLDAVQAYIKTLNWGDLATNEASAVALAKFAKENNVTQQELASSMHLPYADVVALFNSAHVQKFATGGVFSNGIVSRPTNFDIGQMGEAGPETIMPLVNIGGSLGVRAVGGGGRTDTSRLEALVAMLIEKVEALEAPLSNIDTSTSEHARQFENVSEGGNAIRALVMNEVTLA